MPVPSLGMSQLSIARAVEWFFSRNSNQKLTKQPTVLLAYQKWLGLPEKAQHGGVGADLSKTLAKVTQYRQTTVPKLAKT